MHMESSFALPTVASCRLALVLPDFFVLELPSRTLSSHSMRTMLYQRQHETLLVSVSDHRGAAHCVGYTLRYRYCEWQPHHFVFDIRSS